MLLVTLKYFVALAVLVVDAASSHGGKRAESSRNTCSLYIRTDPTLWHHVRNGFPDHQDQRNEGELQTKIRQEIVTLISDHVAALNYFFQRTKFDGRLEHRNIKFEVQQIKIDSTYDCMPVASEPSPFCETNITAPDLLRLYSMQDHEDFCLSYLFTYREFQDDKLGISYIANTNSAGICGKYKTYIETKDGQANKYSLNTGIITLANKNTALSAVASQLNFAREIGHSFGALDDSIDCQPGGDEGNYIMYNGALSGDRPNNSRFSPCSIGNISTILDAMSSGVKRNCLKSSSSSFCGNMIVEEGEECDCGLNDVDCKDRCCYPRQLSEFDKEQNSTAKSCTRRAETQCSPSQGPCCHAGRCNLSAASTPCKRPFESTYTSFCSGQSSECPVPESA